MLSYLALGDSYTIGEQLPVHESFPYQATQLLRTQGIKMAAPEIIAKTGWTSDELLEHVNSVKLLSKYDLVTLLIGVNNQYREKPVEEFIPDLQQLAEIALKASGNNPAHVVMLSIPDWGITPYAAGKDQAKIAAEIDAYNYACRKVAHENGIYFIDITVSQRADGRQENFLAIDGLHPSGTEYKKWAETLTEYAAKLY